MHDLLWNILTLLIWATPPTLARILLQFAMDKDTVIHWTKGLALLGGSLAFGAFIGMLCGQYSRLAPMKEAAAAAAGFLAQDAFIMLMTTAAYYRKNPRKLLGLFFRNRDKNK